MIISREEAAARRLLECQWFLVSFTIISIFVLRGGGGGGGGGGEGGELNSSANCLRFKPTLADLLLRFNGPSSHYFSLYRTISHSQVERKET